MATSNEKIELVSWLTKLLEPVLKVRDFIYRNVQVDSSATLSSAPAHVLELANGAVGDNISLVIPYADGALLVQLGFTWLNPEIPPALISVRFRQTDKQKKSEEIWREDEFCRNFNVEFIEKRWPWNPYEDADTLLRYINALFVRFQEYQIQQCRRVSQLISKEMDFLALNDVVKFDSFYRRIGSESNDGEQRYAPAIVIVLYMSIPANDHFPNMTDQHRAYAPRLLYTDLNRSNRTLKLQVAHQFSPFVQRLFRDQKAAFMNQSPIFSSMENYLCLFDGLIQACMDSCVEATLINRVLMEHIQEVFPFCQLISQKSHTNETARFLLDTNVHCFILKIDFPLRYPHGQMIITAISNKETFKNNKNQPLCTSTTFMAPHNDPRIIFPHIEKKIMFVSERLQELEHAQSIGSNRSSWKN